MTLGMFGKVLEGICFLTVYTIGYFSKFNLRYVSFKGNIFLLLHNILSMVVQSSFSLKENKILTMAL